MDSPYSFSRSTVLGEAENPRSKGNKTRKSPRNEDETEHTGRSTRSTPPVGFTSASMKAAASSTHQRSEYVHWDVREVASVDQGGCQTACTDGRETVAAFGDVVTEVFDLINEVAFSEVIDQARDDQEKPPAPECDGESYKEDDDSIFVRSNDYDKSKKAKEFLGFIGAVKPGTKKIITTPTAPSALLTPNGIPLSLPPEDMTVIKVKEQEEVNEPVEVPPPPPPPPLPPPSQPEATDHIEEAESRDDDSNHTDPRPNKYKALLSEAAVNKDSDDDSVMERSRSRRSTDRYDIISGSKSDGEWESNPGDREAVEGGTKSSDSYDNYIEDVLNKNEEERKPSNPSPVANRVAPMMTSGVARIKKSLKTSISKRFKRPKPKYSRSPTSVGDSSACDSELLTIVESSDEDKPSSSEEEDEQHRHEDVQQPGEEAEADDKHAQRSKQIESEDDTASQSSYSSYDDRNDSDNDDRTYVSYSASDDESFLEDSLFEDDDASVTSRDSVTSRTRYSIGAESQSVTTHTRYSVEGNDSSEELSVSQNSHSETTDDSSYDEEEDYSRDSRSTGFIGDESTTEHKTSVVESLLAEEDEDEEEDPNEISLDYAVPKATPMVEQPRFCSAYDSLYPSDSLFSFVSEKSLFNFSDNEQSNQEPPESILIEDCSTEEVNDEEGLDDSERTDDVEDDQQEEAEEAEEQEEQEDRGEEEQERVQVESIHDRVQSEDFEEQVLSQEYEDALEYQESSDPNVVNTPTNDASDERDGVEEGEGEQDVVEEEEYEDRTVGEDMVSPVSSAFLSAHEEEQEEEEEVAENEGNASRAYSAFASAVYGKTTQSSDAHAVSGHSLPRRNIVSLNEHFIQSTPKTKLENKSTEDEKETRSKHEGSHSNRSSGTAETESTEGSEHGAPKADDNKFHSSAASGDRQSAKMRQLSRIRMFNRHRQNLIRLQQKAE